MLLFGTHLFLIWFLVITSLIVTCLSSCSVIFLQWVLRCLWMIPYPDWLIFIVCCVMDCICCNFVFHLGEPKLQNNIWCMFSPFATLFPLVLKELQSCELTNLAGSRGDRIAEDGSRRYIVGKVPLKRELGGAQLPGTKSFCSLLTQSSSKNFPSKYYPHVHWVSGESLIISVRSSIKLETKDPPISKISRCLT